MLKVSLIGVYSFLMKPGSVFQRRWLSSRTTEWWKLCANICCVRHLLRMLLAKTNVNTIFIQLFCEFILIKWRDISLSYCLCFLFFLSFSFSILYKPLLWLIWNIHILSVSFSLSLSNKYIFYMSNFSDYFPSCRTLSHQWNAYSFQWVHVLSLFYQKGWQISKDRTWYIYTEH